MDNFEEITERYTPMIYSIIRSLHIYKDQDEYYQIGLIALWEAEQNFTNSKGAYTSYAYSTVKGKILNYLKTQSRWDSHLLIESNDTADRLSDAVFDLYFPHEEIKESLSVLTDNQKKWAVGCLFEGRRIEDVAQYYQVSKEVIKSWRKGAIQKWRYYYNKKKKHQLLGSSKYL
ncbi:sigma-70 family RNA polymerase sigma factor [Peribacillus kribbensis]|uniref:sigma-70 family RNA polymerase sigma factor n=1 Tax=Peribacillus kribbensis TaxID=356658 RepID=UPI00041ED432|nr:sigma-70 family RNA polymerase sigma factor [Peribacillus kribbensis]